MKSLTWLRTNNRASKATTEAGAGQGVIIVGGETEVAEVEVVEGAVVVEEDHNDDIGKDKR
jgi:hypothetical protein